MPVVFVYGTLMQNQSNHGFLKGQKYLGRYIVDGLVLYQVTPYYPGVVAEAGKKVSGELYEVNSATMNKLDALEGEGVLYKRKEMTTCRASGEKVICWVYLWLGDYIKETEVPFDEQPWNTAEE